jgi:hypothetical protein
MGSDPHKAMIDDARRLREAARFIREEAEREATENERAATRLELQAAQTNGRNWAAIAGRTAASS